MKGEVKRSIQGIRNNFEDYVMALKRIKSMFGQRSRIAHAVISRVIHGNPVHNRDPAGLAELYYTMSDCMVTLQRLNYVNDLYSTYVLRQAC